MESPEAARQHRIELLSAVILSLVLVGLHVVVLLSAGPLWRDEISSLTLATKPTWKAVWETLAFDPFPAFFLVVLRSWHALFGGSDFTLRILGFCVGLAGIAAFWINARLTGRRTPLLALALLGFSPTLLIWGDSLRPYGVGVLWIVIAFGCFWRVTVNPRVPEIVLTTCAAIMSVQSLFTNAVLIFACGIAAAIVAGRRDNWRTAGIVLGIGAVSAASLIPYLGVLQATHDWAEIRKYPVPLPIYFGVLRQGLAAGGPVMLWIWILLAVSAVAAAFWTQRRSAPQPTENSDRDSTRYAVIAGLLGLITTVIFFRVLSWPPNVWYYLPMLALAAVSIDLTLAAEGLSRRISLWRVGTAAIVVLASFTLVFARVQVRASNLDLVAHTLAKRAAPEDLVIVYPFVDGITFQRYFHQPPEWITIPPMQDLTLHRWDEFLEQVRQPDAISPLLAKVDRTLRNGHRVWIASTFPLIVPEGTPPAVVPLSDSNRHRIGYFSDGWSKLLVARLRDHAVQMHKIEVPCEQEISKYERSRVLMFSGWKDDAPISSNRAEGN